MTSSLHDASVSYGLAVTCRKMFNACYQNPLPEMLHNHERHSNVTTLLEVKIEDFDDSEPTWRKIFAFWLGNEDPRINQILNTAVKYDVMEMSTDDLQKLTAIINHQSSIITLRSNLCFRNHSRCRSCSLGSNEGVSAAGRSQAVPQAAALAEAAFESL